MALGASWPLPFGRAAFVGTWLLRSCSKLGLAPTLLPSELCRVAAKLDQALIDDALVLGLQEGSTWTLMKDVGHFAMSENPEALLRYLLPILRDS